MSVDVRWTSVCADVPARTIDQDLEFWEQVTAGLRGTGSGDRDEFVPLEPRDGDPVLWLQRVERATGSWHLDLHIPDVDTAVRQARECGAELVHTTPNLATLDTPAGQPFCVVRESRANRRRASTVIWPTGHRSSADQLCLDVPDQQYAHERDFWVELTGWPPLPSELPEFERLDVPPELPTRLLFQRLAAEDTGAVRAHLDMSSDDVPAEVGRHQSHGALVIRIAEHWTTLRDPAGLIYCVTDRSPGQRH